MGYFSDSSIIPPPARIINNGSTIILALPPPVKIAAAIIWNIINVRISALIAIWFLFLNIRKTPKIEKIIKMTYITIYNIRANRGPRSAEGFQKSTNL